MNKSFADKVIRFYTTLPVPAGLPRGVEVMNPYESKETLGYTKAFFKKYYDDAKERTLVIGINPGRFGAGLTGVSFADPDALEAYGIPNALPRRREISAQFVEQFVNHWGGPEKFYGDFFLAAVSPYGFVKGGINYNYYDDPKLIARLKPFIIKSIEGQIALGARRDAAVVFGTGKNFKFLKDLNEEHGFFGRLLPVEHPRFVMQYRRKRAPEYLAKYEQVFRDARGEN